MVADAARKNQAGQGSVAELLEQDPDFYSLKHHLRAMTLGEVYHGRTWIAGSTIAAGLSYMLDDIAELEKKWELL
jgi:hypothetical protein